MQAKVARPRRLAALMRKRGWHHKTPRNGMRRRLHSLANEHHPWWDWGHRVMILVGQDQGGNWSEPEPPTWYYRLGTPKRMWRTGYPRHPRRHDGMHRVVNYVWGDIDGEPVGAHYMPVGHG